MVQNPVPPKRKRRRKKEVKNMNMVDILPIQE
jgi:hypothetical protein